MTRVLMAKLRVTSLENGSGSKDSARKTLDAYSSEQNCANGEGMGYFLIKPPIPLVPLH